MSLRTNLLPRNRPFLAEDGTFPKNIRICPASLDNRVPMHDQSNSTMSITAPTINKTGLSDRWSWPMVVFLVAWCLMPFWSFIAGCISTPDARTLADGIAGVWWRYLRAPTILLSFFGCVGAPLLSSQSLERKITFGCFAVMAFFADLAFTGALEMACFHFVD